MVLNDGAILGQDRNPATLYDQRVVQMPLDTLYKRLAHIPYTSFFPLIHSKSSVVLNVEPPPSSGLPLVIKERDPEYQFHRIILLRRLLHVIREMCNCFVNNRQFRHRGILLQRNSSYGRRRTTFHRCWGAIFGRHCSGWAVITRRSIWRLTNIHRQPPIVKYNSIELKYWCFIAFIVSDWSGHSALPSVQRVAVVHGGPSETETCPESVGLQERELRLLAGAGFAFSALFVLEF